MLLKQNHTQVVLSVYDTGSTVGDFIMSTWTTLRKIKIEFEKKYILNIIIKPYIILCVIDYLHDLYNMCLVPYINSFVKQ